ncbi:hypothetical protein BS47DRAFT_1278800, partial [Hydnum rufescens UP504]
SVHCGQELCAWVQQESSWITLIYVPAGCMGIFQPWDVGIQHILKLIIKHAAHADIVNEILALLDNGTLPENILLDKSLPSLRDHSLHWIVKGF